MKNTFLYVAMCLASTTSSMEAWSQNTNRSNTVSLSTELGSLFRIHELPRYSVGTSMEQVSSYDRTGQNDDGFSGTYSFVRRLLDSSLVLFDERGPGVINRIWTPTPSEDSLDFYIDDSTRPAFTIKYTDLFSGRVYPFVAPLCNNQLGGYYCYLPIPYNERCMIVLRAKHTQFYQVGFKKFAKGTMVSPFKKNLDTNERAIMDSVTRFFNGRDRSIRDFIPSASAAKLKTYRKLIDLAAGSAATIIETNSGGRIVGIELDPANVFEGRYKDVDLVITFDGEAKPSVQVPVADFFGYAFGKTSMQSLLVGTEAGRNYCYIPMPFDRSAKVQLVRRKSQPAASPMQVSATVYILPEPRMKAAEGKFYANWNHDDEVEKHSPHIFLDHKGRGHYVGTIMQVRGLDPGMTGFFEGDDSTVVDGRMTMHGTGSEDYFNGGWYAMIDRWDGAFSLPLSGSLDYTLPFSRTGGYRLFISDKIPFTRSIHHSIEHGPERNEARGTYTSVAFFYSDTPSQSSEVPSSTSTVVTMPDTMTIFPQLLTYSTINDVDTRRRWAYNTGGHSIIFSALGESGVRIDLREIPDGSYKVFIDYTTSPQGAPFSLWQRQTPLTDWLSSYSKDTVRKELEYFTDVEFNEFNKTITIRFRGEGERREFFLNRLVLVARKE